LALFDTVIVVDWSARAAPSAAKPCKDAIWVGVHGAGQAQSLYFRTRQAAEAALGALFDSEAAAGRRVLAGFDFAFGYPIGFAARVTGSPDPRSLWAWLAHHVTDTDGNATNRLHVGAQINVLFHPQPGPFWGRPKAQDIAGLPCTRDVDYAAIGLSDRRQVEHVLRGAKSVFQLMGAGSVGSQALTGLPMIHRLAQRHGAAVWPFDPVQDASLVLAEVYPSLLRAAVAADPAPIKDEAQVRLLARALWGVAQTGHLGPMLDVPGIAQSEGWILGAGHAGLLAQALIPAMT
jgi:hypothetical protein